MHLLIAAAAALLIAAAARKAHALTRSGAWAAAVVGFCVFGFAGWPGAAALLLFFVTSSAILRIGAWLLDGMLLRSGVERDAWQVLANGGIAALCAILLPITNDPIHADILRAALLGSIAAANADTWATEVGTLTQAPVRLITTLKSAPPGSSGAVSLPGTIASLAGACLIAGVAPYMLKSGGSGVLAVAIGGFAASLLDSVLGATIQVQYRCPACDRLTDWPTHCDGQQAAYERGIKWFDNNTVNLAATLSGAVIAGLLLH